jgi:hypothetical protein
MSEEIFLSESDSINKSLTRPSVFKRGATYTEASDEATKDISDRISKIEDLLRGKASFENFNMDEIPFIQHGGFVLSYSSFSVAGIANQTIRYKEQFQSTPVIMLSLSKDISTWNLDKTVDYLFASGISNSEVTITLGLTGQPTEGSVIVNWLACGKVSK